MWTKSGILGPTALVHEMPGKDYARAIRTHNITLQAMWQLLLPQFLNHLLGCANSDDVHEFDECNQVKLYQT